MGRLKRPSPPPPARCRPSVTVAQNKHLQVQTPTQMPAQPAQMAHPPRVLAELAQLQAVFGDMTGQAVDETTPADLGHGSLRCAKEVLLAAIAESALPAL
jgi:hypothetical protein